MKEDLETDFKIKNILCDVGSPCGAEDLIKALESKGLSLGFKNGSGLLNFVILVHHCDRFPRTRVANPAKNL